MHARTTTPLPSWGLLIDGQISAGSTGETFMNENPATGQTLGQVALATAEDVDRAVLAARRAFEGPWAKTTPKQRARWLLALAEALARRKDEIAWLETREVGKPIAHSLATIAGLPGTLEYYASAALMLGGETINVSDPSLLDFTLREPLGVCALILPWNYPISLAVLKLAPALAAGNTVVIKPSEVTPASTTLLADAVLEAGIPPGVVNIVQGPGASTGEALITHPGVAKISFTGGTSTGRLIFRRAADSMKRLTMELGGKSPMVVFADADLDVAVAGAYNDITRNSGQVCAACTRLIVDAGIHDRFVDALIARIAKSRIGDPEQESTEMGPIVSRVQLDKIHRALEQGAAEGARVHIAQDLGQRSDLVSGYYCSPILFLDAGPAMSVTRDEIFGPVQTVLRFDSEDEAIRLANDTPYGLAAAVYTRDTGRAMRAVRSIQAGTVCVNQIGKAAVDAPFGGYKQSGFGKERGFMALLEDTQIKNVRHALA